MKKVCKQCGRRFTPSRHASRQENCGRERCRQERRREWQRAKLRKDPEYKENQAAAQRRWREAHPEYWGKYRQEHPWSAEKNRRRQRERNWRARHPGVVIAKMDEVERLSIEVIRQQLLEPMIAKMDEVVATFRSPGGVTVPSQGGGP